MNKACELLKVKPEDAVHVGDDRRNDIWVARVVACDAWLWGRDVLSFKRDYFCPNDSEAKAPPEFWELNGHFIDVFTQLGHPDKATPKTIMRVMGVKGLTLYYLKPSPGAALEMQRNGVSSFGMMGRAMNEWVAPKLTSMFVPSYVS